MRPRRGSSTAVIVCAESDRMRIGIDAAVLDVSTGLLSLSTTGSFAVDEQVKIRLKNVIQRFEERRGAASCDSPSPIKTVRPGCRSSCSRGSRPWRSRL